MEQETLYTASKWEILKLLEKGPLSPIELASLSRTSVANVSQQLRLLEMAGLVSSERVPNRDKGQPRVLYSLAGNSCYMISASSSFVDKKHHAMSAHNKVILRIWFLKDTENHYFLEKGFWQIDHYLPKLQALTAKTTGDAIAFYLVTEQKLPALSPMTITDVEGNSRRITYELVTPGEAPDDADILYDPQNTLGGRA